MVSDPRLLRGFMRDAAQPRRPRSRATILGPWASAPCVSIPECERCSRGLPGAVDDVGMEGKHSTHLVRSQ